MIDESLETLEPAARAAVTVTVASGTPAVDGDRRALCSAFRNLVSNAIKFGGTEPDVRVNVRPAARQGAAGVQIDVADSGCGIDTADKRHVFDAFYRGRAAHESQTSGSGLGLSLVRIVIEAHHGTVGVSSTPGEGSVFSVHLPAIDRAALDSSPEADA